MEDLNGGYQLSTEYTTLTHDRRAPLGVWRTRCDGPASRQSRPGCGRGTEARPQLSTPQREHSSQPEHQADHCTHRKGLKIQQQQDLSYRILAFSTRFEKNECSQSVADRIRDPVFFYPLDPGSGSRMNIFRIQDLESRIQRVSLLVRFY
jgi:hypothetical protein